MSANRFVWYELLTPDPAGAIDFYRQVIGWGTTPFEGDSGYTMWTNNDQPFGGLMKMPAEAEGPPAWLGYLGVDNVDAKVAEVVEHGGKVFVPPTDIPGAGRFAVLADPQGGMFAVHQSPQGGWVPPTGAHGSVCWHELAADDAEAAEAWYSARFGWTSAGAHDMGEMLYRMVGVGDPMPLAGIFPRPPELPVGWSYYIDVADLDATLDKVRSLGGQVLVEPMEIPGGARVASCMDPQGAMFSLHSVGQG
jgi:predicted enzyme related to lactoylglutathione lyase